MTQQLKFLFVLHVLMLMSPIRLEQSLPVDSCEFFMARGRLGCTREISDLRCHSGGLYIIHSFGHDQIHVCDLDSDLNARTCALQLTPSFSHRPLKKSTARRTEVHTHIHRTL